MRTIFSVIPTFNGNNKTDISMEVLINDGALSCLSAKDLRNAFCRVRGRNNEVIPVHVKFVVDSEHDFLEYNSFFRKLEEATGGDINIDICTSGRNFNSIMTCLGIRNSSSNYSVYVDDHNVRENLEKIDLSRVACDCYLSKRYIRNLSDDELYEIYNLPRFKFNRREVLKEREIISECWGKILPTFESLDGIKPVTKIALVSDFINQNIGLVNSSTIMGEIDRYINGNSIDSEIDVYQQKRGTSDGQMSLAALLLDNYFAKTDCRVVEEVSSKKNPSRWLATSNNKGNYLGFPLSVTKGVNDFVKRGSRTGKICLEKEHDDRDDYEVVIHSFGDILSSKYANVKDRVTKYFGEVKKGAESKIEEVKQYAKKY